MGEEPADPWPSELRVREAGRVLRITFADGFTADISAERLRAASPSADKRRPPAGSESSASTRSAIMPRASLSATATIRESTAGGCCARWPPIKRRRRARDAFSLKGR
jgi:hypothetical protein